MGRRGGQSTVEFALLIPFLLAVTLLCVEFAFYFSTIHYDNYVAFAAARVNQVGGDVNWATRTLLDGNVTRLASVTASDEGVTLEQPWDRSFHFYGTRQILGNMDFALTVNLGSKEADYEGTISPFTILYADNNVP